jgi:hypothetical protein
MKLNKILNSSLVITTICLSESSWSQEYQYFYISENQITVDDLRERSVHMLDLGYRHNSRVTDSLTLSGSENAVRTNGASLGGSFSLIPNSDNPLIGNLVRMRFDVGAGNATASGSSVELLGGETQAPYISGSIGPSLALIYPHLTQGLRSINLGVEFTPHIGGQCEFFDTDTREQIGDNNCRWNLGIDGRIILGPVHIGGGVTNDGDRRGFIGIDLLQLPEIFSEVNIDDSDRSANPIEERVREIENNINSEAVSV